MSHYRPQLGEEGIENADELEVARRKHSVKWGQVSFYTSLAAPPGSILFFRRKGVTHLPGFDKFSVA